MLGDCFTLNIEGDDGGSQQLEIMEFDNDTDDILDCFDGEDKLSSTNTDDDEFILDDGRVLNDNDPDVTSGDLDNPHSSEDELKDDDYVRGPVQKRARQAFYPASMRAVERAALRTNVDVSKSFNIEENGNPIKPATPKVPGTWGRQNGSKLSAYSRKITNELDSDDELMVDMRDRGFSDRQIAERLTKEGRSRYNVKSIATRITRIRKVQAEHVDWLLKEGYMEWCMEEDQLLLRAFELADIEVRCDIERTRAWRFRKVAEHMRRLNKEAIFSADACRDRYFGLINGTAKIPIDEDDDPDARRLELEQFRSKRESERAAKQAVKNQKEADARRIKEEAKARQAKKSAEAAGRRQETEQTKAARMVYRATQAQIRSQRALENQKMKAARNAAIETKRQAEKEVKERRGMMKIYAPANLQHVTADTPDPRIYVSVEDLKKLCTDHGLSDAGNTKEVLVKRLKEADGMFNTCELRQKIKEKGISLGGSKLQMQYQLALHAALSCSSYQELQVEGNEVVADNE